MIPPGSCTRACSAEREGETDELTALTAYKRAVPLSGVFFARFESDEGSRLVQ